MDFRLVTSTLLKEFNDNEIEYAVIGGFALGLWNVTRSTIDMDFLLLVDDLPRAETILSNYAYRRTFKSENVAQYVSDLAPYGQLDVLIAFRTVSRGMLKRRVLKNTQGRFEAFTLLPEDLAGLKLQAMVNDPKRVEHETLDISSLLAACKANGESIDWELLQDHFSLFEKQELFQKLKNEHGQTN